MSETCGISPAQAARYQRQLTVIGRHAQRRLLEAKAIVIGLGGLGVPAATQLSLSGIGTLLVNDFDVVELSNLSRQFIYTPQDLMSPKAAVIAERLKQQRPDLNIETIDYQLDEHEMTQHFNRVDIVLDCTDNFESRFAINRAAYESAVPLISASALRREGQLAVFDFRCPDSPCYQCLFPSLDAQESDCNRDGILCPVLGVMASMQVMEAIRLLVGSKTESKNNFYRYHADDHRLRASVVRPDPRCPVCRSSTARSHQQSAASSSAILSTSGEFSPNNAHRENS